MVFNTIGLQFFASWRLEVVLGIGEMMPVDRLRDGQVDNVKQGWKNVLGEVLQDIGWNVIDAY